MDQQAPNQPASISASAGPGTAGMAGSTSADTWPRFLDDCDHCRSCSLGDTRQHVVVYRGAVRAPLMIIGEGPGAEEDLQGKPFVGAAGRLLDLLLTAQGFPPESYHIGNIVKCRPPENRVPAGRRSQSLPPAACPSVPLRQAVLYCAAGGDSLQILHRIERRDHQDPRPLDRKKRLPHHANLPPCLYSSERPGTGPSLRRSGDRPVRHGGRWSAGTA